MALSSVVHATISCALAFSVGVFANDAEFGRIITFDNFDHFKVSNFPFQIKISLKKFFGKKNSTIFLHVLRVLNCELVLRTGFDE